MATPSSTPFYGSSTLQGTSMTPVTSSTQRVALDNIIRRELKVGDPNDPKQVAEALLTRYKDTPRAQAISQEAKGLPFLLSAPMPAMVPQAATSSDAELQQAKDDVDRDLHELTTNSLLKDVTPELQGWAQAVRSAIQEGTVAARFALDPRQRDKAFAIRRQLGDYARLARLVGALTPSMSLTYRKFAQSLDEVAAVVLVTMGEALANVGFNGGRFLLQAPYSELQVRRDTAIYALRNLIGATQEAFGPNVWPRGLDAYRSLFRILEEQGQGDLRALLLENELARTMDELIQRAAHGRAEGLRALGATAQLDLERFRRLVIIGRRAVSPESPPLTAFLEALALFADAFESSGGFRLMRIARPPILFYGLYGTTTLEDADRRLLDLIIQRGLLADELDCFMQCGCSPESVRCQIILDKILYDLDRAIDLYALGKDEFGQPERRAAAYSFLIEHFLDTTATGFDLDPGTPGIQKCTTLSRSLHNANPPGILEVLQTKLRPPLPVRDRSLERAITELTAFAEAVLQRLTDESLCVRPAGSPNLCAEIQNRINTLNADINDDQFIEMNNLTALFSSVQRGQARLRQNQIDVTPPAGLDSFEGFFGIVQQELCIQKTMEERWENLVKTMAPDCFGLDDVFDMLGRLIDGAIARVSGSVCPSFAPSIPPHFETSLDSIVADVDRIGRGRPNLNGD
jgi:hypothetical protein